MSENNKTQEKLIKGFATYTIGNFGSKILSFLIVPLYTYYISTTDMGVYDILMASINLISPIMTLQISEAAYRWMIRSENNEDRNIYIRSTFQVLIFNSILASAIIFLVNYFITIPYCGYFVATLILSRTFQTTTKLLRGLKNQKLFAFSGILYTIIFLSSNILQICVFKRNVIALFSSAIIANISVLIFIFFREKEIRCSILKKPDKNSIKMMIGYSAPLVPNSLNWWVINSSDKFIVKHFLGLSSTGILGVSHRIPGILQAVLELFTISWQDVSVGDKETSKDFNSELFKSYYIFSFTLLWFLIPSTKAIVNFIMSDSYKASSDYIAFYYLGTVFQSFSSFYGVGYLRSRNTKSAFITSVYAAIINAVINLCFVKFIGMQASAVSTFIAFFVMWLVRERQNRKELKIDINWVLFLLLTSITVVIALASIFFNVNINAISGIFTLVIFVVFNKKTLLKISFKVKSMIIRK